MSQLTPQEVEKHTAFRTERKDELQVLAEILSREEIVQDTSFIYNSANSFSADDRLSSDWRFVMAGLEFTAIDANNTQLQHIKPTTAKEISIFLTVDLIANCVGDDDLNDPFRFLQLDIEVEGKSTGSGKAHVFCAWHLDKHPHGQSGHFVHPLYHIQYGGNKVWNQCQTDADYGRQLLLASPRIAHPPLDLILAVDFVLSNFFAEKWSRLRNDAGDYIDLVKQAQKRYWCPYAIAMASNWDKSLGFASTQWWSPQLIYPQLQVS